MGLLLGLSKGVGQDDYAIALIVVSVLSHEAMVDRLDVDRGDIVRQRQDLMRMQLVTVLVLQLAGSDEIGALHHARDEGAGTRERIQDMNALAPQTYAKLLLEDVVDRVVDEIDHLDWGVDDAELLLLLGEGHLKEAVEEVDDDLLPVLNRGDILHAKTDTLVEGSKVSIGLG